MIKKITAIVLTLLLCMQISAFAATEYNYIEILQTLGAIDLNSEFPMDSQLTRAQFAKMAIMISPHRDSVATNISVSPFIDVTHKYWGAPYIHAAVTNGIINGYIDGTFRPEDPINYEEALTIALKILGYTNDDFGSSWPNGQLGTANKIGLTDNLVAHVGENILRADAINILYNTLTTPPKGANTNYVNTLGYSITDDVTIISTSRQDSSIAANKVSTSAGMFNITNSFDYNIVGKKGSIVTEQNDLIHFFPDGENRSLDSYAVYAPLANDILVYKDGTIQNLGLSSDTTVYMSGQQTVLKSILASLDIGYVVSVSRNDDGTIDYITVESNTLEGPTVATKAAISGYSTAATIIRDGKKASLDSLKEYDILYYSKALETVWAYSKKITGIYESASPNKDTPTSVTVSGVTYALEGAAAYSALSSAGSFNYGDTITLLLGRGGDVAGVVAPSSSSASSASAPVAGYLIEAGQKQFINSEGDEYTSLYAAVVQPDGKVYEYTTTSNYKSLVNSVVSVSFSGGKASIKKATKADSISGKISYSNMMLGTSKLADNVEILDVSSTSEGDTPLYTTVFAQRLDGMSISPPSVLYYSKNSSGEIEKLILKNVTGDMYTYGVVTKADVASNGFSASYSYMASGSTGSITSTSVFSVLTGEPAKFILKGGKPDAITPLTAINTSASNITYTTLSAGGKAYPLSDKVSVYEKTIATTYTYLNVPLNELVENQENYTIRGYLDRDVASGGRVRVIMIEKK